MTIPLTGVDALKFNNLAQDPVRPNSLQRSGASIKYHDGTAAREVALHDTSPDFATLVIAGVTVITAAPMLLNITEVRVAGTSPRMELQETDAAADNMIWDWFASGQILNFRAVDDARTGTETAISFTRSGATITQVRFQNGTVLIDEELELDGPLNHDGSTVGLYAATPVTQAAHIVDADGTLADITTKFNTLLVALDADAGVGLLAGA